MELNGTTFVLEIVNFVILVWILKRFLYRPVLDVIAARKAAIEKTLADAQQARADAQALRARYESRIEEWNTEREHKLGELSAELETERKKRREALLAELASDREKDAAGAARREQEARAELERQAVELGARYVARLLKIAATAELEAHLIDHAIDELGRLSPDQAAALTDPASSDRASVRSAFDVDTERSTALTRALRALAREGLEVDFGTDPSLLAGIEITIGAHVLAFNLRDELAGFATLAHER